MKTKGAYYLPKADKIIYISKCEHYTKEEVLDGNPVSLVTWIDSLGEFPKTLITKKQFKAFRKIGEL